MRRGLAAIMLFLFAALPAAAGDEQVTGVVELAPLCYWKCEGYDRPVALYYRPREEHIPANFVLHEDVKNWPDFEEYNYEEAGALVYGYTEGWYKIRRNNEFLWVAESEAGRFHAYPDILRSRLAYISNPDVLISDSPGAHGKKLEHPYQNTSDAGFIPVEVSEILMIHDNPWVRVNIMEDSPCYDNDRIIRETGWIPAYDSDTGNRNLWFFSRGC